MTKLATQLARARARKGVPAIQVSQHMGFDISGIYAIENGRRDARASTIDAITDALGFTMLLVDTDHRGSIAEAADEIRGAHAEGRPDVAAQVLVQVVANLTALKPFPALAISYEKPAAVDQYWDAALAGVVEFCLTKRGLPAPAWTADVTGDENARWDPWTGGAVAGDPADIPEPLRRRGVWIEEGELASV